MFLSIAKKAERTEKFDTLQGEMKELKSQMEMLTKKLKQDEKSSEQSCTASGKDTSLSKNKKKKKKIITSTKDAKQSCEELRKKGHFANGFYQVEHQTETKKVEVVSCEFIAANNSN